MSKVEGVHVQSLPIFQEADFLVQHFQLSGEKLPVYAPVKTHLKYFGKSDQDQKIQKQKQNVPAAS